MTPWYSRRPWRVDFGANSICAERGGAVLNGLGPLGLLDRQEVSEVQKHLVWVGKRMEGP
jgi:hypothetical protein